MQGSAAGEARGPIRNAILIAGPTASGKSALALRLAERHDGVIVNADSMQVYAVLRVLTARPTDADLRRTPHFLYGHVDPLVTYSTGAWLRDVASLRGASTFAGKTPIFVGGTGLYFKALTEGLSDMPDIPPPIRSGWRQRLEREGPAALHDHLSLVDAAAAEALHPGDGQRIVRALEVLEASGRSILEWQTDTGAALVEKASARLYVLAPQRDDLVARIESRFDRMVADGALEEVRELASLDPDPSLPATKAIGFRELRDALDRKTTVEAAIVRAKTATRQYSKRQTTWFRNQFGPEWLRVAHLDDVARADA